MTNLYGMLMGSGLCALPVNSQRTARDITEDQIDFNFLNKASISASSNETLFNTYPGTLSRGWDVLLRAQVDKHVMCFDGIEDGNDAYFCKPEDQSNNNQEIAKSTLRLLSVTTSFRPWPSEAKNLPKNVDLLYRTTAPRVGANDGQTRGIHDRFDLWHRMAQKYLESKNQQNLEDGVDIPERTNKDQYFPADLEDIVEFFEMLYSSPDEDSNFERFMILYDKLLDWVFARYFAIAKSEDGDGDNDTWYGKTEEQAGEGFTFHLFAMASS